MFKAYLPRYQLIIWFMNTIPWPYCPIWMWQLDCEESWVPKNWCFWTVVLEKTLESPLNCKEIKPVNAKGNQPWIFIGMTDADLNIHWNVWCWSANTLATWCEELTHWQDPDAGKDQKQEKKGMTKDKMVGWHHWLNGHEFEQVLGNGEGQGILACYRPWGHSQLWLSSWKTTTTTENKLLLG